MADIVRSVWPEWEIEEKIGEGSSAVVYRVKRSTEELVLHAAVKVITLPNSLEWGVLLGDGMTPDTAIDYLRSVLSRFVNEIRTMQTFRGLSNIVHIDDYAIVDKEDGIGWYILIRMELLTPLNQWLGMHRDRHLDEQEIIRLGIQLCDALSLCEARQILHRDIKPENIFVNDFGFFKLGDFGIARQLAGLTDELSQKGTPLYTAPEVTMGSSYDCRADLYSLGLVLYKLANGNALPFIPSRQLENPLSRQEAVSRRLNGDALPCPSDASDALSAVLLKACAYDPKQRYASAEEMKQALEAIHLTPKKSSILPYIAGAAASVLLFTGGLLLGSHLLNRQDILPASMSEARESPLQEEPPRPASAVWNGTEADSFAGGDGTELSPYEIATPEQLAHLSTLVNAAERDSDRLLYAKKAYRLTSDLVMNDEESSLLFTPIGSEEQPFIGSFDGAGYVIHSLRVEDETPFAGLFGYLSEADIRSITLSDVQIVGNDASYCGAIAAVLSNGTITDCRADGFVSGTDMVGGLIGKAEGASVVSSSEMNGQVHAQLHVGGLIGLADGVCVTACENHSDVMADEKEAGGLIGKAVGCVLKDLINSGSITGDRSCGGIVGKSTDTEILSAKNRGTIAVITRSAGGIIGRLEKETSVTDSVNENRIRSEGQFAGGIIGWAESTATVTSCSNRGDVTSEEDMTGGIVGKLENDSIIKDSDNTAIVEANGCVGGIAGYLYSSQVIRCENTGRIVTHESQLGGVVGFAEKAVVQACVNQADVTIAAENLHDNTEIDVVGGICGIALHTTVSACENRGNIRNQWNHVGGIIGMLGYNSSAIQCENSGEISGFDNTGGVVGVLLTSQNDGDPELYPCSIEECINSGIITGGGSHTGGIAGLCYEKITVSGCENTGDVSSFCAAGGIVGLADKPCEISGCSNVARIDVNSWGAGGIVGSHWGGMVSDCYSGGTVTGYEYVGGIVGRLFQNAILNGCCTVSELIMNHGDGIHTTYGIAGAVHSGAALVGENYYFSPIASGVKDENRIDSEETMRRLIPEKFKDAYNMTLQRYTIGS